MMPGLQMPERAPEAQTMAIPKRWPLVQTLNSRNTGFNQDARIVNGYAEKDVDGNDYNVEKRPGFKVGPVFANPLGNTVGQGVCTQTFINTSSGPFVPPLSGGGTAGFATQTLVVVGNVASLESVVYSIVTTETGVQTTYNLGTILLPFVNAGSVNTPIPQKVRFLPIPGQPYPASSLVLFGSGQINGVGTAYIVTGVGASAVLSTAGGGGYPFPNATVPGFVYLNGNSYVMDITGAIWETQSANQVVQWSANFITFATDADMGMFLARQKTYVIAIKQWTTGVYYDAGNAPPASSLSPVPGAVWGVGCLHPDTVADLDEDLFWVTNSKKGTYKVVMMRDLNIQYVSTPAIERLLDGANPGGFFASYAFQHAGHRFYVLTVGNTTMVFDVDQKLWYLWTDYQGNKWPCLDRCVGPASQEWHQFQNGSIYQLGADYVYPNDYGNVVPVDIYTPNEDFGAPNRYKYLPQMAIEADQYPGSQLFVRYSDNDYKSWSNFRKVDLSQNTPIINDEGSFRRRAYHFRHFANTPFRLTAALLQMDVGTL